MQAFLIDPTKGPFDLSTSRPGWPPNLRALVFGRKAHARAIVVYVTDTVLHVHGVFSGQDIPAHLAPNASPDTTISQESGR